MREHDRITIELTRELRGMEQVYLQRLAKYKGVPDKAQLQKISILRDKIQRRITEKKSVANNMLTEMQRFMKNMDIDLNNFESYLKSTGGIIVEPVKRGIEPGSDVAFKPIETQPDDIILGRVIDYNLETEYYEIADADESSVKKYHVHENFVTLLDLDYNPTHKKLTKGEEIYAVYPETTRYEFILSSSFF